MQERRNRLLVTALALSMLSVGVQSAQAVDIEADLGNEFGNLRDAIKNGTDVNTVINLKTNHY